MIIKQMSEELREEINKGRVVLDFYASWCGPCQMLSSVLDQINKEEVSDEVNVIKVNVEDYPEIAGDYSVLNVPTLVVLENGTELRKQSGFMPKPVLIDYINR